MYSSEDEAEVDEKHDNDDENQEDKNNVKEKKIKIKKNPANPQPKLDAQRLCGERGLKTLLDTFKDVKFKETNSEFKNLDILMNRYKYWCHRLYPKMPFDEVVEKIEKIGQKREVKFMADRIRNNQDPSKLDDELNQINTVKDNADHDESENENEDMPDFRNAMRNDSEEEDALISTLNI